MKKSISFFLIILISPVIAGIYGILNDQLTYSISPEYYTKFKFYQFGLVDPEHKEILPNPRVAVSIVGFMATWWVGVIIGFILAIVGLIHSDGKKMFLVTIKAIGIVLSITFITGILGLVFGLFYLTDKNTNLYLQNNLIDVKSFIAVGSMHNFGYIGGLLGLVVAGIYGKNQTNRISKMS